jgi:hypothetical protein
VGKKWKENAWIVRLLEMPFLNSMDASTGGVCNALFMKHFLARWMEDGRTQ